ncbi:MAG TPA: alpha/beta hydrolase-fold protein [Mycobacteriales bacterium]|nr:alpha/beta hydrolase-fold protein [Mycobacteriales bacterium]
MSSPTVDGPAVGFELVDRHHRLAAVRLVQEIGLPDPLLFTRVSRTWRLEIPRPDVDRMEYLLEIEDHNGHRTTITDPANPRRASGAFGDKSVVELPGYRPPRWLDAEPLAAEEAPLEIAAPGLESPVTATVWAPSSLAADDAVPLLVVHDGPEYASLGGLTHYLGTAIAAGALPPLRAALLGPAERNEWYSANPTYASALCTDLMTVLDNLVPTTLRVGVGVSLGGLAMLHAHRMQPQVFDALLLQSGSFFTPVLDPQESGFSGFAAVTGFVADVLAASSDPHPVPTVLTCGVVEENLGNNAAMAHALQGLGYPAELVLLRDAHNFTAWRDALDPNLSTLVTDVVGAHAS